MLRPDLTMLGIAIDALQMKGPVSAQAEEQESVAVSLPAGVWVELTPDRPVSRSDDQPDLAGLRLSAPS